MYVYYIMYIKCTETYSYFSSNTSVREYDLFLNLVVLLQSDSSQQPDIELLQHFNENVVLICCVLLFGSNFNACLNVSKLS